MALIKISQRFTAHSYNGNYHNNNNENHSYYKAINYIITECSKLAQNEYKIRHD